MACKAIAANFFNTESAERKEKNQQIISVCGRFSETPLPPAIVVDAFFVP